MKVAGKMDVAYTYPGSGQNNGRISAIVDNVLSETVTYQYDQLNRLTRATSGSSWDLEFLYDALGNRTEQKILAGTGPSTPILSFYQTNNKISTPGYAHDANGNLTNIAGFSGSTAQTLDYDPANRLNTWKWNNGSPTEYAYDSGNKRIRKCTLCDQPNKDEEFYLYGISGELLGAYELVATGATYKFGRRWNNVYFGGRLIYAQDKWVITDQLGSVRWREGAGAVGYYPYGEVRTGSVIDKNGFGTYFRDNNSNLDYADQRYYGSTHARFLTPDPYQASAGPSEPGSWNRFSYVEGDPVNGNDPSGLLTLVLHGSFSSCGIPDYQPGSDFFAALRETYGEDPVCFEWDATNVFWPSYAGIYRGAGDLIERINDHAFAPGEKLNIVAHSHGGNVVKIASWFIEHRIDSLVTLGTPINYDLWEINPMAIRPFSGCCAVSSLTDWVQFFGASPEQVFNTILANTNGYYYSDLAVHALFEGDWLGFSEYSAWSAAYFGLANLMYLDTKIGAFARNVFTSGSHSSLHSGSAWRNFAVSCGLIQR